MDVEKVQMSVTIRLASDLVDRLDQLAASLSTDSSQAPRGRVTRAEVLRQAVVQGLVEMEKAEVRRTTRP